MVAVRVEMSPSAGWVNYIWELDFVSHPCSLAIQYLAQRGCSIRSTQENLAYGGGGGADAPRDGCQRLHMGGGGYTFINGSLVAGRTRMMIANKISGDMNGTEQVDRLD